MYNIVQYFNTFLYVIFGYNVIRLETPINVIRFLSNSVDTAFSNVSDFGVPVFESFILSLLTDPSMIFSIVVWIWFAVLTVNLLLIFPYKWIRSVIRKCNGR